MMMTSNEIRQAFFDFFEKKGHQIVPSAPIVNKNDPTLMFTNAGMNPFKDYFLGTKLAEYKRVADTQKCLRVSGKHNDLEDVGLDGYHHTMFEMLGNWSFGDYFKKEAIAWSWELLTKVYKLPKDRLYVTVFEGDEKEGLAPDQEAADYWAEWVDRDRIIFASKKDNFWEMGDVGPCGPCSEIHIDTRSEEDVVLEPGYKLVNADHPEVIEIWNNVFIQFNRKSNGSLEELPAKHVDTGMGFERLCRAIQKTKSNYDTDLFTPFIQYLEVETNKKYNGTFDTENRVDIAFRVLVDHIRAVVFTIADGEMPSNTGAGYVIRRILRRAVRYYYSYMDRREPLMAGMVPLMVKQFGHIFPEILHQSNFIQTVIHEEEKSFLRTLGEGMKKLDSLPDGFQQMDGKMAFELYDTFGFPIDLTRLIGNERGWTVDEEGFTQSLKEQKTRSRADAQKSIGDWVILSDNPERIFVGYDADSEANIKILRYRTVQSKDGEQYQVVLDKSPFYPEGGGQVGDTGLLKGQDELIKVCNTVKENDLSIHLIDRLPENPNAIFSANIDIERRRAIEKNHSATHLLHAALRKTLGVHVQQKGSLVSEEILRFDFSHFQKMTQEELNTVEDLINAKIQEDITLIEDRQINIDTAKEAGAMMLFGEKYAEKVRMITFDPMYSRELCGGCHVKATGKIGYFKIISESAIAAGVRRLEAVTGGVAVSYSRNEKQLISEVKELLKSPLDPRKVIGGIQDENRELRKQIETANEKIAMSMKDKFIASAKNMGVFNLVLEQTELNDLKAIKSMTAAILREHPDYIVLLGFHASGQANILLQMDAEFAKKHNINASNIIKDTASIFEGGGGGQPHVATSKGKNVEKLNDTLLAIEKHLEKYC